MTKEAIKQIVEEYEKQDNLGTSYPYVVLVQELIYEFADEVENRGFMRDKWKTIATFFTSKAAHEYIKHNLDDHNKLRTYVMPVRQQYELRAAMDAIGLKDAYQRKMDKLKENP